MWKKGVAMFGNVGSFLTQHPSKPNGKPIHHQLHPSAPVPLSPILNESLELWPRPGRNEALFLGGYARVKGVGWHSPCAYVTNGIYVLMRSERTSVNSSLCHPLLRLSFFICLFIVSVDSCTSHEPKPSSPKLLPFYSYQATTFGQSPVPTVIT